jgi:hypothetical protein
VSDPLSNPKGFIPLDGCADPSHTTVKPQDWISCTTYDFLTPSSSCSAASDAYTIWGPLGSVLCPANRNVTITNNGNSTTPSWNLPTECTDLPYGADNSAYTGSGTIGNQKSPDIPLAAVYCIVVVVFFVFIGMFAYLMKKIQERRTRVNHQREEEENRRDSWDQGLPAYEKHWSPEARRLSEGCRREWGVQPPEYEMKRPQRAYDPERAVTPEAVDDRPGTQDDIEIGSQSTREGEEDILRILYRDRRV